MENRYKVLLSLEKAGRWVWIPGEALYNTEITSTEKILLGLICDLSQNKSTGHCCVALNAMLAYEMMVAEITIRKCLAKLEKHGYIKRELEFSRQGIVIKRKITINPEYKEMYKDMLMKKIITRGHGKSRDRQA